MQKTTNYNLKKPESSDPLRVADFNENADIMDAALNSLNTAVGSKAEQSAVTALQSAVNGKGNCRIAAGAYKGNGRFGPSYPNVLTMDFAPQWVMVAECGNDVNTAPTGMKTCLLMRPLQGGYSTNDTELMVTWTDTGVSWYCDEDESSGQLAQNNRSGYLYKWVAIGAAQ